MGRLDFLTNANTESQTNIINPQPMSVPTNTTEASSNYEAPLENDSAFDSTIDENNATLSDNDENTISVSESAGISIVQGASTPGN